MKISKGLLTILATASVVSACTSTSAAPVANPSAAVSAATSSAAATASAAPTNQPTAATTQAPAQTTTQTIGLQQSDVLAGLQRCAQSGDVAQSADADTKGEWSYQQKQGATSAFAQVFADATTSCAAFQAIPTGGPTGKPARVLASVVTQFKDDATARAGATGGVFGVNPSHDIQSKPGAISGTATGLGDLSFYVYQGGTGALGVALWQRKTYVVALIAIGLAESDVKKAAASINARIP